jgi:hypothetical protein
LPGAATYTVLGAMRSRAETGTTRIDVARCSSCASAASWVADMCSTTTKATPVSGGVVSSNVRSASMPPADPPMPTTGNMR